MRKRLANALELDFRVGLTDAVTPHAGGRCCWSWGGAAGSSAQPSGTLPAKRSTKGLRQGELVEALVLLSALGGGLQLPAQCWTARNSAAYEQRGPLGPPWPAVRGQRRYEPSIAG